MVPRENEEKSLRKRIAELSSTEGVVLAPLTKEDFEAFERGDLRYYWETKEMALKRLRTDHTEPWNPEQ